MTMIEAPITGLQPKIHLTSQDVIGGPCSLDNTNLVISTIRWGLDNKIGRIRFTKDKPRTAPWDMRGLNVFQGLGDETLPWLTLGAENGLHIATEVMFIDDAIKVKEAVVDRGHGELTFWNGAKNINHRTVNAIGELIAGTNIKYFIKNPAQPSFADWVGLVGWAIAGGADPSQMGMIYRGECLVDNNGLRNTPRWEEALEFKVKVPGILREGLQRNDIPDIPMYVDTSHLVKTNDLGLFARATEELTRKAIVFEHNGIRFDGLMVETHPNPAESLTDPGLSHEQYASLLIPQRGGRIIVPEPAQIARV